MAETNRIKEKENVQKIRRYRITDTPEGIGYEVFEAGRITSDHKELYELLQSWPEKMVQFREDYGSMWTAGDVRIIFQYRDEWFYIEPQDIGLKDDPEDEGYFKYLSKFIRDDLIMLGAADIICEGQKD